MPLWAQDTQCLIIIQDVDMDIPDSDHRGCTPTAAHRDSADEIHTNNLLPDTYSENVQRRISNREHNKLNKLRQKEKDRRMRATKTDEPFTCPWCDFADRRSIDVISHV